MRFKKYFTLLCRGPLYIGYFLTAGNHISDLYFANLDYGITIHREIIFLLTLLTLLYGWLLRKEMARASFGNGLVRMIYRNVRKPQS